MEIVNIKKIRGRKKYIEDVARLMCELWNESDVDAFCFHIKGCLRHDYSILVAYLNDEPVGYIELNITISYEEKFSQFPIMYICGLYVSPYFRKQGVASELIKEAENYAREKYCTRLASDYFDYNIPSANLHEKMGFKITSRRVNVIKDIPNSIIEKEQ